MRIALHEIYTTIKQGKKNKTRKKISKRMSGLLEIVVGSQSQEEFFSSTFKFSCIKENFRFRENIISIIPSLEPSKKMA